MHGGDLVRARSARAQSAGTKVLSVSGDCARPGVYEYPFGVTVRQVLDDCGAQRHAGGAGRRARRACCSPRREFDRRIAFEDVPTAGAFMVFDDPARHARGGAQLRPLLRPRELRLLHALPRRHDAPAQRDGQARGTARARGTTSTRIGGSNRLLQATSHCGLGHTACNPVLDTLKFRPAIERRLTSLEFAPAFDLDEALAPAREMTGRDDAGRPPATRAHEPTHAPDPTLHPRRQGQSPSPPGQTVLQAALAAGIYIPHLCSHPEFEPHGSCRCAR